MRLNLVNLGVETNLSTVEISLYIQNLYSKKSNQEKS